MPALSEDREATAVERGSAAAFRHTRPGDRAVTGAKAFQTNGVWPGSRRTLDQPPHSGAPGLDFETREATILNRPRRVAPHLDSEMWDSSLSTLLGTCHPEAQPKDLRLPSLCNKGTTSVVPKPCIRVSEIKYAASAAFKPFRFAPPNSAQALKPCAPR